jgi:hypothetical protein
MTQKEFNPLLEKIETLYNKDDIKILAEGYYLQLKKLLPLIEKEGIYAYFLDKKSSLLSKSDWATCFCMPFATPAIFHAYRGLLNENQQKVWDFLVLNGFVSTIDIALELGISITEEDNVQEITEEFKFLPCIKHGLYNWSPIKNGLFFTIPLHLTDIAKSYYAEMPNVLKELKLFKDVPSEIKTQYIVSFEENIFSEFSRLQICHHQGNIVTTTKGYINQMGLGKLQRTTAIKEFFPNATDKYSKVMRTHLMASLMVDLAKSSFRKNIELTIKTLFEETFLKKYNYVIDFMYFYKNIMKLDSYHIYDNRPHYYAFFKGNLTDEWQSIDNLFVQFRLEKSDYRTFSSIGQDLYYDTEKRSYSENVNKYNIRQSFNIPLFKACVFLFAAYGLVEIAYNETNLTNWLKDSYSFYDGLKYVRLTNLGKYVFGRIPKYEPILRASKNVFSLSETNLNILIESEESPETTQMLLSEFGEKISQKRYYTDYQIFLKSCKLKTDVSNRISLFRTIVGKNIPAIWQSFFAELLQKVNPLEGAGNCHLFKIPADNTPLIQLISKDEILRKCVFRAEGFYLIIPPENLNTFRKRLQEFGYLLLE